MRQKKEEIEHIKRNKAIYDFVDSEGWKYVKSQLLQKIDDLQSVMNVDCESPEKVLLDIRTRKNVIDVLLEWLRDVEGQANQYEMNELSPEEGEMRHISREEE